MRNEELRQRAQTIRKKTFQTIYHAGGGHYGGSLSAIEIMTFLYFEAMRLKRGDPDWPERDRFILAKGHAGPPLYVILAELGYIDPARLDELDRNGGSLPKHVDRMKVQGIEFSSGPLGQGLSVACGVASSMKMDGKPNLVYTLLGDGELDEGQVWEAAMTARHYRLDNLIAFLDRNMNQIDGNTEDVMALEPLADKWTAFGWYTQIIDGHDMAAIRQAVDNAKAHTGTPSAIIANTVKGKGISFMENQYTWHSGQVSAEQFQQGMNELESEEDQ